MKTHWLFGSGPNKEVHFNIEIDEETDCKSCIHRQVCDRDYSKRCTNFAVSCVYRYMDCCSCTHSFTRYDKDKIPCFHCKFYLNGDPNGL